MKVNIVVVDSGPIIKGAILENISKHAVTVPGVIKEIKDLKTRQRIRNLPPYFFSVYSPSNEALKHVISISRKTGDLRVLSPVDLDVLALAYEMQFLKTPEMVEKMFEKLEIDSDIESDNEEQEEEEHENNDHFVDDNADSDSLESIEESESDDNEECVLESALNDLKIDSIDKPECELKEDKPVESNNDDSGWITIDNFDDMKSNNFGFNEAEPELESVSAESVSSIGCLTTDYAMQNILLQMGVKILSIDGLVIREPRIFVSYCRSCFKQFRRTDIFFCPHCGNANLGKVPAQIKQDGQIELFLKKNFQPNLRHTIFSIPTPKGGKHRDGNSYVYCADQRLPDERTKKSRWTFDVSEEGNLPFVMNEVTSRSAVLGINQNRNQSLRPTKPRGNKCSRYKK